MTALERIKKKRSGKLGPLGRERLNATHDEARALTPQRTNSGHDPRQRERESNLRKTQSVS